MDADKWQDISTAPRDGTPIIAYWLGPGAKVHPFRADLYAVTYCDEGLWRKPDDDDDCYAEPTHWPPLPPPPEPKP